MSARTLMKAKAVVVNIRLRVVISAHDYQVAYGPATSAEMREYVKATAYEAVETGFPPDIPVDVEEVY